MDEAAGVTTMPVAVLTAMATIPQQADSDAHLVALWRHGRTARTLAAYASEARAFLAFAAKPLRAVTLGDLHAYMDSLAALAPASRQCRLAAIKSLFGFAHRLGYLPFNPGAAVRLPPAKDARGNASSPCSRCTGCSTASPTRATRQCWACSMRPGCASPSFAASPGATCSPAATPGS